MPYARRGRQDANHAEIRDGLRRVPHVRVADLSSAGDGIPDLLVLYGPPGQRPQVLLLECKVPKGGKLTKRQQVRFAEFAQAGFPVEFATTLDEAKALVGYRSTRWDTPRPARRG